MNVRTFDLEEFLHRDPAEVDALKASMDFLCLGTALLEAVGYERNDEGEWGGQEDLNSITHDGEFSLCFAPGGLGYVLIIEMDIKPGFCSTYSREAYLPYSEKAGKYSPRVATNVKGAMDCVYIPVPPTTGEESLERAYATAQSLSAEVLEHYGVTP